MTITLVNNQMLIEDVWIDGFVNSTTDISVEYSHNCGESVILSPTLSDVNVDNQLVIDISEGAYYVTLLNITDPQTIGKQELCVVYITEETKCKIEDKVAEECDTQLISYYVALSLVNNCECKCDKACKIYEKLTNLINDHECNC